MAMMADHGWDLKMSECGWLTVKRRVADAAQIGLKY